MNSYILHSFGVSVGFLANNVFVVSMTNYNSNLLSAAVSHINIKLLKILLGIQVFPRKVKRSVSSLLLRCK